MPAVSTRHIEVLLSQAVAPANTVAPAVTGTATVGSLLSTTDGTWTGSPSPTFTYQWQRDVFGNSSYSDIGSATSSTYTLVDADDACNVRCVVKATNDVGQSAGTNSNVVGAVVEPQPANSGGGNLPAISGSAHVGQVQTATTGTWTNMGGHNPTYTYQWQDSADGSTGWANVASATSSTYTVGVGELNLYLRCAVVAHNTNGSAGTAANSAASTQIGAALGQAAGVNLTMLGVG